MISFRQRDVLVLLVIILLSISRNGLFAEAPQEPGSTTDVTSNSVPEQGDPVAARYLNTCAGCHSLSGAKLTGPDLSPVVTWPEAQLKSAIKRMEEKVGPLADSDVESLARFLQATDLRPRLEAESARIQSQFAAKLDVGSPARGRALFEGREAFANQGLSCVACHQAAGNGGRLGPDLTGAYVKMGEMPLLSSLDNVGFKIMATHYQHHPITKQEAVHLVSYMKTLNPADAVSSRSNRGAWTGVTLALVGCVSLAAYGRRGLVRRSRKLEYRKH